MALVIGGPANGATISDATAPNFVYNADLPQSPYYSTDSYYVLEADGNIHWEARPTGGPIAHSRDAYQAWTRLMRRLGIDTPRRLRRSALARAGIRRAVR